MQEDIKKIAESLGYEYLEGLIFLRKPMNKETYGHKPFNPYENGADAFMVLEALVKLRAIEGLETKLHHKHYQGDDEYQVTSTFSSRSQSDNFKHAICTAYLSLIGDKDNG